MLHDKIKNDLNSAMKERREFETDVLRMISAALHNYAIEKRSQGKSDVLEDEDVIAVLNKEIKKRKEAAELFKQGNRPELQEKEQKEIVLIERYVPARLSKSEIEAYAKKAIEAGAKDFGSVMKAVMQEARGRADGKTVGEIVKGLLG